MAICNQWGIHVWRLASSWNDQVVNRRGFDLDTDLSGPALVDDQASIPVIAPIKGAHDQALCGAQAG